jgi:hypothetical protein
VRIGAKTPLDNHKNGMEQALLSCRCRLQPAGSLINSSIHPICTLAQGHSQALPGPDLCCWHGCKLAKFSSVVYVAQAVSMLRVVETLLSVFAGIPHAICTSLFATSWGLERYASCCGTEERSLPTSVCSVRWTYYKNECMAVWLCTPACSNCAALLLQGVHCLHSLCCSK